MKTIGELRNEWRAAATVEGINPRDFDLLLADAHHRPVTWLIAHDRDGIDDAVAAGFERAARRRFAGEPLQYIRGRSEFYGRDFSVDRRVLIPRPETEFVVDAVLERAPRGGRVVDVGTGSGCIAATVALERSDLRLFATDRSVDALALAKANALSLGSAVRFVASDVLDAIGGAWDVIASNPPYVPARDAEGLQREVRDHEPHLALFGGDDGLDIVRRLIDAGARRLAPGGLLVIEIGFSQAAAVTAVAESAGWHVELIDDLAAIPRVVVLSRH
jgi:release factor glutamine methyltransferase